MNNNILSESLNFIDEKYISEAKSPQKKNRIISVRKATAVFAAALICIVSAVPALAAKDVRPAYELLYSVSPELAQRLKPVKKSCISSGIQIEVTSADIHDDTAEVLVAVKDLESDRIDSTIDLFDSYIIHGLKDNAGTCRLESYDEENGIASFLIYIEQMNGRKIDIDKVTFSVSEILTGKTETEKLFGDFDLSSVPVNPETVSGKKLKLRGEVWDESCKIKEFLVPQSKPLYVLADGAYISAAGYFGNQLHIQVYYEDILRTDNHGFISLKSREGKILNSTDEASFWDSERKGSYEEYAFDISRSELFLYELYGEITTCGTLIEGDWEITFPLEAIR